MIPDRDPLPPRALVALLVDVLDRPTPRQRYADGAWGILLSFPGERRSNRTGDGGTAA